MASDKYKHTNSLIKESSPYLLQHAHNPVNWYAWRDEAFIKAESENKLIFLSIGYSTCHWCHVMAHESFEDEEVAELMNRAYVSIKVDREERPDLDALFMETAMMMNRSGGWPLNLILTPDGKPFFAATYIPKNAGPYSSGMMKLLPQIESIWVENPQKLTEGAEKVFEALKAGNTESGVAEVETSLIAGLSDSGLSAVRTSAFNEFKKRFDKDSGGFSPHPKFPQPQNLLLLMHEYHHAGTVSALAMVEKTLQHMRAGGVYDQIGFGFHRYSTDSKWLLPHFEKMLYDQAMLIIAYTEAYQLTGKTEYRRTAEEVIEYVLRDMRSDEGTFFSAEDADSAGREGKFYLWDYNEFTSFLNKNGYDGRSWADYFKLSPAGNFFDEASKIKTGENILHTSPGCDQPEDFSAVRQLLFIEREKRIHPYKDDKILTDWNGLMITAFAKAGRVFEKSDYIEAAEAAADFIISEMKQPDGSLLHTIREGKKHTKGMIDDYAFFIWALLELYRADFNTDHIKQAVRFADYTLLNFEDIEGGGFYQSDVSRTDLLIRKKALMDNAIPSGNSVMYENLMQLFKITGEPYWRKSADAILHCVSERLQNYPAAFGMLISSLDFAGADGREIIITGSGDSLHLMLSAINKHFVPGSVVIVKTPDNSSELEDLAPYTKDYSVPAEGSAAYVCTGFSCNRPVFSAADLQRLFRK